jgi:hypothetical protein
MPECLVTAFSTSRSVSSGTSHMVSLILIRRLPASYCLWSHATNSRRKPKSSWRLHKPHHRIKVDMPQILEVARLELPDEADDKAVVDRDLTEPQD